ncbi:putative ser/thr protein phosphatase 2A regulatory subunit A [Clavulina sp. PMI_390]|nr:putative ser/thr protein phosphatase 2A regulatory subunit A [Clavulina sp. PMI_390]
MSEGLYPIAILIDELKSEDVAFRLNAIRRLSTIALALGPQRAREELVPFLQDSLDDEDEVLLALADELGKNFEDYLGGPEFAHLLLGPLENLAAVEETLVRDKATESISKIFSVLSPDQTERFAFPLVRKLATGDWFTSRISAAALHAPIYPHASPSNKDDLRKMFATLASDDTPMVRRAAAKHLGSFVKSLPPDAVTTDALPIYNRLARDDQDSVRLLTVEDLIAIAELLTPQQVKEYLLPSIRESYQDKSWRVRYMVANTFVKLAESVGQDIVREELVGAFTSLLKDNEAEVRTAAAGQIPGFARLITPEVIIARLLPPIRDIATDQSQHVRAALGGQITGLAPLLGKEATIEHLLPLFLQLLKDEFPEVRLNIISKLEQVNNVIGIELLSQSLLPAIVDLAEDKQWRVRQAIIEYIPLLATQLGVSFFDEQLGSLCMSWLGDTVFSIREAATQNLKRLAEVFGAEWATTTIVPKVLQMGNHPNYLYRMTTVFAITTISPALTPDVLQGSVMQTILALVDDPIPNIRFNVAKSLEVLAKTLAEKGGAAGQQTIQTSLMPAVETLKQDPDADVRYFAERAYHTATNPPAAA